MCLYFAGCISILLVSAATLVSSNSKSPCYSVKGQNYCFYTDDAVLRSWDDARDFCATRNSTLPIITNEDIDEVFQRFIIENNIVEVSDSVWLDAHARRVNDSVRWHWINNRQPSGSHTNLFI